MTYEQSQQQGQRHQTKHISVNYPIGIFYYKLEISPLNASNAHDMYLDLLIKLQKKCVRVITFSYYLEYTTPLFGQLDILSFKKIVIQRISLLMFKRHTGSTPLPINNLFTENNAQYTYFTRQTNNLHTQIRKNEKVYFPWNKYMEPYVKKNTDRCIICMQQKCHKGVYIYII